jgi:hypothetical protein
MTRFAFTAPLAHLKDFEPYSDFVFGLSFLLDDPTYKKWVIDHDWVLMDNSFNETQKPATVADVLHLSAYAECVIQPDADHWTPTDMLYAYEAVANEIGHERTMGIFRTQKERQALENAGALNLAISYWWRRIIHWSPSTDFSKVHFLGLGSLGTWTPASLDTTIPIKWAIRGEDMAGWDGSYELPSQDALRSDNRLARAWKYFHTILTDKQLDLAVHNIAVLRARFATPAPAPAPTQQTRPA